MHYLSLMRRQRINYLIYILMTQVELDFRQDSLCSSLGLKKMEYTKDEKEARKLAEQREVDEATEMVEEVDESKASTFATLHLPFSLLF
jgi:hypothetical protein